MSPIIIFFPSPGGGVQHGRVLLANALAARGNSVICVMPLARGAFLKTLDHRVEMINLGTSSRIPAIIRFAQLMRRRRPRAVLVSNLFGISTAVLARMVAAIDTKIIAQQHHVVSANCSRHALLVTRLLYPLADHISAVSRGVARDLAGVLKVPESEIVVIPNTTITPDIGWKSHEVSGHPWIDAKTAPVILAVGNLRAVKHHGLVIRAFAHLRRHRLAKLIILGEGEERPRLEELVCAKRLGNDVDLPGHASNPFSYMRRADVLALSSRHEGFGNVLLEAMACGCPVVSTDCPYGPREILDGGRYGQLVPVDDPPAMATALDHVLSTDIDRDMLRHRASEFTIDRMLPRYFNMLMCAPNDMRWTGRASA